MIIRRWDYSDTPENGEETFRSRKRGKMLEIYLTEGKCEVAELGASSSDATELFKAVVSAAPFIKVLGASKAVLQEARNLDAAISGTLSVKPAVRQTFSKRLRASALSLK